MNSAMLIIKALSSSVNELPKISAKKSGIAMTYSRFDMGDMQYCRHVNARRKDKGGEETHMETRSQASQYLAEM